MVEWNTLLRWCQVRVADHVADSAGSALPASAAREALRLLPISLQGEEASHECTNKLHALRGRIGMESSRAHDAAPTVRALQTSQQKAHHRYTELSVSGQRKKNSASSGRVAASRT